MNFLTLSPGDAIYVPADAPHAYLSGDIVECMACSNNVLNTGFCLRADKDSVELFTATLTISRHIATEVLLKPTTSGRGRNGKTEEYLRHFVRRGDIAERLCLRLKGSRNRIDPARHGSRSSSKDCLPHEVQGSRLRHS